MELKKQGNYVFGLICSLNSSELKQFRRFLKFEFNKATPYLKMLSFIEKYQEFDYENSAFPEDLLLKKCGVDIEKNYTKYKYHLKQSTERFIGYLALKNEPKSEIKHAPYFLVKILIAYKTLYRLELLKDVNTSFTALAKEASAHNRYALSVMLNSIVLHNTSYTYFDKLELLKKSESSEQFSSK